MVISIRIDETTEQQINDLIEIAQSQIPGLKITKSDIIKIAIYKAWYEMTKESNKMD